MTRLDVRSRVHLTTVGETEVSPFVRCPEDGRWMPVRGCRQCAKAAHVSDATVTCSPVGGGGSHAHPEDAPIAEAMADSVLCVDAGTNVRHVAREMQQRSAPIAVVVDRAGHAVGVCSGGDLADASPARRVERCMTPFVISLLDGTTVGDALSLVVERGLDHVPVLSEGRVVGVVTPRSLLRWVAQNLQAARTRGAEDRADARK